MLLKSKSVAFIFSLVIVTALAAVVLYADEGEKGTDVFHDYKQEMRLFVQALSAYAKARLPDFIVIPQNGHELLTADGNEDGPPAWDYIESIDGAGREDLFYGYKNDDAATPPGARKYMLAFMDLAERCGIEVLATDYCSNHAKMDDSYRENNARGYVSFAAPRRELDAVPDYPPVPYRVHAADVRDLSGVKNFLYLLNPDNFPAKEKYLQTLRESNYDCLIIDRFFHETPLTAADLASLKRKANRGRRLVIAYMSIGEAEDYRPYWNDAWVSVPPSWLAAENPQWQGNYKVRYWDPEWQKIIFGSSTSYLDLIITDGFDGVYLDIIDAFEYFEETAD